MFIAQRPLRGFSMGMFHAISRDLFSCTWAQTDGWNYLCCPGSWNASRCDVQSNGKQWNHSDEIGGKWNLH
jgi:hypothetical protein